MIRNTPALAVAVLLLSGAFAGAAVITVTQVGARGNATRKVTAAESAVAPFGGSAPTDGNVFQYVVTTDADILGVYDVRVTLWNASLYNHPFGNSSNAEPPDPALVAFMPALAADSWVTTPGATSLLGDNLPGDGQTAFVDNSDDGPQTNFMFAQLTVPARTVYILGTFRGKISIKSAGAPVEQTFDFPIFFMPEPSTSLLTGLGTLVLSAARRRKCG